MLALLLSGYIFLLIFRPYEYWTILGELHIERIYMILFIAVVFLSKHKRYYSSSLNGSVLFFTFVLLVSGFFSLSWDASWRIIEDYLKYVIFYFMVLFCVRDEYEFRFVALAFLVVMFLYMTKSSWEFFVNGRHFYRMGIVRMLGIDIAYGDPNSFAATICYSLPLVWAMMRSKLKNFWLDKGLLIYCVLALICIISTGSRSGMVTTILFLMMVLLGSSRKILSATIIIFMFIVSWDFMPQDLQTRFLSTFFEDVGPLNAQESASGRLDGFLHGIYIFIDNPIIGVGPNNFPLTWPNIVQGPNAHNLFGQLLSELGIMGAASFLLLLFLIVKYNMQIISNHFNALNCSSGVKIKDNSTMRSNFLIQSLCSDRRMQGVANPTTGLLSSIGPVSPVYYSLVAQAIIQTIVLMLFKGWADHNLYRYTWLWLAALTVLNVHFFRQTVGKNVCS